LSRHIHCICWSPDQHFSISAPAEGVIKVQGIEPCCALPAACRAHVICFCWSFDQHFLLSHPCTHGGYYKGSEVSPLQGIEPCRALPAACQSPVQFSRRKPFPLAHLKRTQVMVKLWTQ